MLVAGPAAETEEQGGAAAQHTVAGRRRPGVHRYAGQPACRSAVDPFTCHRLIFSGPDDLSQLRT